MNFWEMVLAVALGNLLWTWFDPAPDYASYFGWRLLFAPVVLVRRWWRRRRDPESFVP